MHAPTAGWSGGDLVVAHQGFTDRLEDALDQIRLVRQQEAQFLEADDLGDILQYAARAIGDQLHPIRQDGCECVEDAGVCRLKIGPGIGLIGGPVHDQAVGTEGHRPRREVSPRGKLEVGHPDVGKVVTRAAVRLQHLTLCPIRAGRDGRHRRQTLLQPVVEEKLEQGRPRRNLPPQHGQQVVEVRLASSLRDRCPVSHGIPSMHARSHTSRPDWRMGCAAPGCWPRAARTGRHARRRRSPGYAASQRALRPASRRAAA